ncbi:SMPD2 [Cordylochernes scorpioides]|uniref:sphingomyelin phosphodiesterase n=1 Tax=Cordylochernes scorpioides TaxID=51811 RepID=A0ABY6L9Y2_9ARAC|nr:SMPD2 [Cordylochernes scorpioides]
MAPDSCKSPTPPASASNQTGLWHICAHTIHLSVNALHVWCRGLVGVSKNRRERMQAIGNYLANKDFDFVFLQEVWKQEDFQALTKTVASVLPYSHYFYSPFNTIFAYSPMVVCVGSGVIGSGVCILSRVEIKSTLLYRYTLNGYPHKFLHGDWFGGKGVGLCRVELEGLAINLYVTHLHAEYNRANDGYLAHRISQSLELAQFVRHTADGADVAILGGDLNTEPGDLPHCVIQMLSGWKDAFVDIFSDLSQGMTCGHPRNTYTSRGELQLAPAGKRIDYVLYRCSPDLHAKCVEFHVPMTLTTDSKVSFSDHEPLEAIISVRPASTEKTSSSPHLVSSSITGLYGVDSSVEVDTGTSVGQ